MKINSALILDIVYPIGSYYWNNSLIDIDNVIGGHWERVKDKFVLAVGDTYTTSGATGGSETHSHTLQNGYAQVRVYNSDRIVFKNKEVDRWYNSYFVDCGSSNETSYGQDFGTGLGGSTDTTTNLPPYITAYCWKRIS